MEQSHAPGAGEWHGGGSCVLLLLFIFVAAAAAFAAISTTAVVAVTVAAVVDVDAAGVGFEVVVEAPPGASGELWRARGEGVQGAVG